MTDHSRSHGGTIREGESITAFTLRKIRAEIIEECAMVAERIWDEGKQGAHGGEQANRTAAAIRALSESK